MIRILYLVTCERFSLIWVNRTRLIYRYWFSLSVACLHAQELYTPKEVAQLFLFKPAAICRIMIHRCPKSLAQELLRMRCIHLKKVQRNSPPLQGKLARYNSEHNSTSFCLAMLVLFPSFHYKCSVLGFGAFPRPNKLHTINEKTATMFGNTRW